MPWWAFSLGSNVCVATAEYAYRASVFESFWHSLWILGPLNLAIAYCLFHAYPGAPSLIFAWAFHSVGNMAARLVVAQFLLHEPVSLQQVAGLLLMFAGAAMVK